MFLGVSMVMMNPNLKDTKASVVMTEEGVSSCIQCRFFHMDKLRSCIESIPLDEVSQQEILQQFQTMLPSYVFLDEAKHTYPFGDGKVTETIDLLAELSQIANTTYKSDAAFHQDLYELLLPLRDAHTVYVKPSVYAPFYAFLPIDLHSIMDKQRQVIQFYPSQEQMELDVYTELYGTNLTAQYQGWEVLSIDGHDVWSVLRNFTDTNIGQVKDDGSRFNIAINGFGNGRGFFYFRSLMSFQTPETNFVQFELKNPTSKEITTLKIHWIGLNGQIMFPLVKPSDSPLILASETPSLHRYESHEKFYRRKMTDHFMKMYLRRLHQHSLLQSVSTDTPYQPAPSNAKFGILKIASFEQDASFVQGNWLQIFSQSIEQSLAEFVDKSNKTLIIDLRGNGGGDICLGYTLLRYLFPQIEPNGPREGHGPHTRARYHVRKSELFRLLSQQGANRAKHRPSQAGTEWSPNAWFNSATHTQYLTDDWYSGGPASRSEDIYFGCAAYENYFEAPGTNFKGLPKDRLVLLSDGLCGSTCAVFSSFIQLHGLGTTVVIGGYANERQQFWSFPGGEVYRASEVSQDAAFLGLKNSPLVPIRTAHDSDLTFAMLAIHLWNSTTSTVPLEYVHVPADYHIMYDAVSTDENAIFEQVVELLR